MKTGMTRWVALGLAGAVVALLGVAAPAGADEGQGRDQGVRGERRQKLLDGDYKARIEGRIAKIQARLAKHPNAPADVKAAAEKLIADLKIKEAALDKLVADLKARNRAGVKADREDLKKDRAQCRADRKALWALIKQHRQERRAKHAGQAPGA